MKRGRASERETYSSKTRTLVRGRFAIERGQFAARMAEVSAAGFETLRADDQRHDVERNLRLRQIHLGRVVALAANDV